MPITKVLWSEEHNSSRDIHVLRGQSTRDLTLHDLLFDKPGAEGSAPAANTDVTLTFTPLFRGSLVDSVFVGDGNGITVDTRTGVVTVSAGAPARRKNNFIIEVAATNPGSATPLTEVIRVQVHNSVSRVWLSPDRLTVRPTSAARPEKTNYRFSVRAQFDDGVIGDLTDGHGVTWTPASNAETNGKLTIATANNPGDNIVIKATLPLEFGAGSAEAQLHIDQPWTSEPSPPKLGIIVGGGWPGTISPEQVPNILMLGDGFAAGDRAAFERIVNTFVHHLKNNRFTRPFDVLTTSMNFWGAFMPSSTTGISVRSEVSTVVENGKTLARPMPVVTRPPPAGDWNITHLMYAVGLPVPGEEAKSNAALKSEWAQLVDPTLLTHITDDLIDTWKACATRALIEERDGFPGLSYGELPAANGTKSYSLALHDERADTAALKPFYEILASDAGVTLAGGAKIGQLWANKDDAHSFDNRGLVVIISSFPGGRASNSVGLHMHVSTEHGNVDIPVKTAVPGLNALFLDLGKIPAAVSADRCRTVAHELGHSFGLDDEYAEVVTPLKFPDTEKELAKFANVQTDDDARSAGKLNSAEIKWNWHRICRAAVLSGPITQVGSQFLVPLRRGGLQFTAKDKLLLRLRPLGEPLKKARKVLDEDTLSSTKELQISGPPLSNSVMVQAAPGSTATLPDLLRFVPGSILYVPTPAPATAGSDKYANLVAKNIADFISTNQPLTAVPCVFDDKSTQVPILGAASLPGLCFKHKTKIVGLYSGGSRYACGIFHPTGTCMMRAHRDDDCEFCAVCRYIMVDMIDPYHHEEIDRDYDEIYPLR